jgi:hypothetical protein
MGYKSVDFSKHQPEEHPPGIPPALARDNIADEFEFIRK